eukprot:scaffold375614_cov142-Cyclotella_meneghiniana.AAC.1
MARGARSVSVQSQELYQAGCCVRAVVVFVMVGVFFSVFGGGEVASREGRETLELAAIDEKDARR